MISTILPRIMILAGDVLPLLVHNRKVYAYKFGGKKGRVSQDRYWRDVGTIDSYYKANMDLLKPVPPLNLYHPTGDSHLPAAGAAGQDHSWNLGS